MPKKSPFRSFKAISAYSLNKTTNFFNENLVSLPRDLYNISIIAFRKKTAAAKIGKQERQPLVFLNLDSPIRWLFLAHAVAGALALGVLVIPLASKKGGSLHVKTGWVYTFAMMFVGFSSFIITPWRLFIDGSRTTDSQNFSLFLFYISVFTLTAISHGIQSLRAKQRKSPSRSWIHIGPPILTFVLGLFIQLVGLRFQNLLLLLFPFLGHFTAAAQLKYWLRAPTEKMHWWYAHMNGMFVACIATITAFLVTAAPRVWPGPFTSSPILWIAPGIILGGLQGRWIAAYRKNFEIKK